MDCEVDEFEENLLDLSKTALKRKLLKSIDDVKRKIAYEISQTSSSSLCSNYSIIQLFKYSVIAHIKSSLSK
jgi:hypothetical protein